jgi:DNA-binding GntR family transcriptional regulator
MQGKQLNGTMLWFDEPQEQLKQGDIAYYRLRKMIVSLQLEPGEHVDEQSLSRLLDLGRTPIREALQRLAQDNLVMIIPRKGTTITPINMTELQEVSELRWELESLAARWAAQRITPQALATLENFVQEAARTEFAEDQHHHVEADRHFHLLVARAAANRYLLGDLDQLFSHSVRLFYASGAPMAGASEEIHDYRNIVQALRGRDGAAAENFMQIHLQDARKRVATAYGEALNPATRQA